METQKKKDYINRENAVFCRDKARFTDKLKVPKSC